MARSKGYACGCSYVHCRETHVRLTSDGGEANEMLLFHGTGATKPQARAELRRGKGPSAAASGPTAAALSGRGEFTWEKQARVA